MPLDLNVFGIGMYRPLSVMSSPQSVLPGIHTPALFLCQALGLEAEGRSQSLGSAGSQSLSGFSITNARTLSHGSATLEGALDGVPTLRGRTSMESAPEIEPVWG